VESAGDDKEHCENRAAGHDRDHPRKRGGRRDSEPPYCSLRSVVWTHAASGRYRVTTASRFALTKSCELRMWAFCSESS
jgi:hypothetical protein